ncbi:MAG: hypothetical protein K9H16_13775, partial [Bacteroidales bacterium]|nr:hypothetical protein [Bacteroidales bacterium]
MVFVFLSGCNITRNVPDDEYLLKKNVVTINKKTAGVNKINFSTDDLDALILQQPNDKLLGIAKIGVWVNSFTARGKETRFKKWLNKSLGQEPVIFEDSKIARSLDQMDLFLNNNGYFNSDVSTNIITKKKKVTVEYHVRLARPYKVNGISYRISDPELSRIISDDAINSKVTTGINYSADDLDHERSRISSLLRNEGYFYFSPEFVFFEIDSAFKNHTLKVYTNIQAEDEAGDTMINLATPRSHQKYYINEVSIDPDFNPVQTDTSNMKVVTDTTGIKAPGKFNIYFRDKLKIKSAVLTRSVFLKPSLLYSEKNQYKTYRQLSGFPLFGFTSFNFSPATNIIDPNDSTRKFINCMIELTRRPVQSFSIETEGTTSGSKLGLAGNFVYRNLNIFRGGEVLSFRLTGGVEWQAGSSTQDPVLFFFNTIQTGAEASI